MGNTKWNSYFGKILNKYNLKMNKKNPIVIFLDGKEVTRNSRYNLISENKNSFNDIFEQTIKHFSKEFECIAISGIDETSFIFEDGRKINKFFIKYRAHDIVSVFSQHFYKYFNDRFDNEKIYWHCKCSNIPRGKIKSYIRCRCSAILESKLTYFLKRKNIKDAGKIPLAKKKQMCSEIEMYKEIKEFEKGKLYISGEQVDLEAYLNDQIIKLPEMERKEMITFLDLNSF